MARQTRRTLFHVEALETRKLMDGSGLYGSLGIPQDPYGVMGSPIGLDPSDGPQGVTVTYHPGSVGGPSSDGGNPGDYHPTYGAVPTPTPTPTTTSRYPLSGINWATIPGALIQVAATENSVFALANNGGVHQVFRYNSSGANWTAITGTITKASSIAATENSLYMVGNNGGVNQVWRYNGSGTNWTTITGTNTTVSSIGAIGNGLYMTASNGGPSQSWQYNGSGNNWTPLA